ncbi:MAG: patatin-like phospholipase family protein [Candidatus Wallbacteria bacterium]
MSKIGLVLSGGGGKGSYQVGAWKAIKESNILINAVAGTSVGALNGALYQMGNIESALKIWENIAAKNVLSFNIESMSENLLLTLTKMGIQSNVIGKIISYTIPKFMRTRGVFSQRGLNTMMDEALNFLELSNNQRPFFTAVHNKNANCVEYLKINGKSEPEIKNTLLASCALPFIFDDIEINKQIYTDGGWYWGLPYKNLDNTPIKPLYECGCDIIIAIYLSREDIINRDNYPGVKILPIVPVEDPGGISDGVLDFSNSGAKARIESGYIDTMKVLSKINEFVTNEKKYDELWQKVSEAQRKFDDSIEKINFESVKYIDNKTSVEQFNDFILNDKFDSEVEIKPIDSEDIIAKANLNLLTQIERNEMTMRVDDFIARNANNSIEIEETAFEAISCLAPIEGRAGYLAEQGILRRLWNMATGKNLEISAANEKDIARAQYAAIDLISKIQKKNLISFEFSVVLNNKINGLYYEAALLGQKINEQYIDVYKSLSMMFVKLRNEIIKNKENINELNDRVSNLEWFTRIQIQTYDGVEYRKLSPVEQLMCLTNDFYKLTDGNWSVKELLSFKQAIINLQVEKKSLTLKEIRKRLNKNFNIGHKLFEGLYREEDSSKNNQVLLLTFIQKNKLDNDYTDNTKNEHFNVQNNLSLNTPVLFYNIASELLFSLKRADYKVIKAEQLDPVKKTYIDFICCLGEVSDKSGLAVLKKEEMDEVTGLIKNFIVKVPVIGPFNSGKTTLLNKYLETDLLKTDSKPETAIATELRFAYDGCEKIILHYLDGSKEERSMAELDNILALHEKLFYIEIYLNSYKLNRYKNIVPVDMPGLDSNVDNHNKAVYNYIEEGVTFVVCVDSSQVLKESVLRFMREISIYNLDFYLLMTQIEIKTPENIKSLLEHITCEASNFAGKNVKSGKVSAFENNIEDFDAMMRDIDKNSKKLFQKNILPVILPIAQRVKTALKILLNKEDVTVEKLKNKRSKLDLRLRELDKIFNKEKKDLYGEIEEIADEVKSDVSAVLSKNQSSLKILLKNGLSIESQITGMVQNTFKKSVSARSKIRFEKVEEKISRYINDSIYKLIDSDDMELSFNSDISGSRISAGAIAGVALGAASVLGAAGSFAGSAAGLAMLGPIGVIAGIAIGGLLMFMAKAKQEREMNEKLKGFISEISEKIKPEAIKNINIMADIFFVELGKKVEELKKEMIHNMTLIEEQLKKSDEQIAKQRQEAQNCLEKIDLSIKEITLNN